MEIKKNLNISSDCIYFWRDISHGTSYIDFTKICVNEEDNNKIKEAIKILKELHQAIRENY